MFKIFKGLSRSRKIAKECSSLTQKIVNYLIINNYSLQLEDTVKIFKECYTFCVFISYDAKANQMQTGIMIENSKVILKEWLQDVFFESSGYRTDDSIDSIIDELNDYYTNWVFELGDEHSELKGLPLNRWIPECISKFIGNIDFYIYDKFGKSPEKFSAFLYSISVESIDNLR